MTDSLDHLDRLNLHLSNSDKFDGPDLDDLEAVRDEIERLRFFTREVVRQEGEGHIPGYVVTAAKIALQK